MCLDPILWPNQGKLLFSVITLICFPCWSAGSGDCLAVERQSQEGDRWSLVRFLIHIWYDFHEIGRSQSINKRWGKRNHHRERTRFMQTPRVGERSVRSQASCWSSSEPGSLMRFETCSASIKTHPRASFVEDSLSGRSPVSTEAFINDQNRNVHKTTTMI